MEKISEMIKRMCPNGVERVKLSSFVNSIHTGLNPRSNFKLNEEGATKYYVTVKEITSNKIVFSSSTDRITDEAWNIIQNRSHLEKGDVLFSGIGTIGKVVFVNQPVEDWNCSESVFVIKPKTERINGCYLAYILRSNDVVSQYEACAAGSIMKGVRKATLESLEIPLPPLPIQQEIVRILDSFTLLHSNLEAELVSRQKQYEFYRNKLFTFDKDDDSVERKILGDVGEVRMCKRILKSQTNSEIGIPFYKIGTFGGVADAFISKELYDDYKSKYNYPKKGDILISAAGTIGRTVEFDGQPSYFQDSNIVWIENDEKYVTNKYLKFFYSIADWKIQNGGSVSRLYNDNLKSTIIPIPSLQRQQEIVSTLDTFESLITNLKKEIEARKKQYEYYREQLLTFE